MGAEASHSHRGATWCPEALGLYPCGPSYLRCSLCLCREKRVDLDPDWCLSVTGTSASLQRCVHPARSPIHFYAGLGATCNTKSCRSSTAACVIYCCADVFESLSRFAPSHRRCLRRYVTVVSGRGFLKPFLRTDFTRSALRRSLPTRLSSVRNINVDTTMKQVYLKTITGKYFMVRKISKNNLGLEAADLQNGEQEKASTARVELHRKETQLAIVFIRDLEKFLLTVQKKSEHEVNLELKDVTDGTVQEEDHCFKWENMGAGGYQGLSTVAIPQKYISISPEAVVGLTSEITHSAQVKVEAA